ncbi:hypothetical protein M422DRAFT_29076 [Sphaerobolus stellatus SS14]|uniref:Unplaced genomic scaffold SPHSTscaffold_30, whole genome shotgun sequence n=1 Tax=Sphaerobolus stellatus (strain SS14) TaxID=990650 RepID=A0A0C9VHW2_SPHS4|nr:hypothetical protein M422DRAFT_39521 [Sphaerobolus stellatus SS14]KIJ46891.1 hypothetical protein M422DRAFT_29076 [Sphaerobolus stellatus SS14]
MQNVDLSSALRTGKVQLGFSSTVPHGFVDLVDLTSIAMKIMNDPAAHNLARYEFVSENVSYDEITRMISDLSGRQVKCDVIPAKDFLSMMNAGGEIKNEFAEDAILRMMVYYDRWGLIGNPNVLKWLLGRQPTTWEAYLRRELPKFTS